MWWGILILWMVLPMGRAANHHHKCGGTYTDLRGILQTPNFPGEFPVPIRCEWIIDSQNLDPTPNSSIIVYLTQLFVYEGLKFTEYPLYDKRYPNLKGNDIHVVSESNVTKVGWLMTHESYLVITLELDSIESTHVRVLDKFLDVYGFNITYEMSSSGKVREDACTMLDCGFTGVCYDHYTKFSCDCLPGFSGPNCAGGPKSPCTTVAACKNGATCLNVGTEVFMCNCPPGYMGKTCEIPSTPETNKDCQNCLVSCPFDGSAENTCHCPKSLNSTKDLVAFSAGMHLGNLPNVSDEALRVFVEKQMHETMSGNYSKSAGNLRVHKLGRLRSGADVILHFYGPKKDEKKVRNILTKWAMRGYIGNLTVAEKDVDFVTVELHSVSVNRRGLIRSGEEFILSCEAKGPRSMSFRWFKDGLFVNVNLTKSNKWRKLVYNTTDQYIDILEVDRAGFLDEGTFTCQVEINGIQYCRSLTVQIRKPPLVKIEPMSLTVSKFYNFSIKCISMSENTDNRYTYIWRKNGKLLPIKTQREKYEILYPGGSILQVAGIDKSTVYSCLVQDRDLSTELNVTVDVIDRNSVRPCGQETRLNVTWPETAPGTRALGECPQQYAGRAKRSCGMKDRGWPVWDDPDFSGCANEVLRRQAVDKFHLLASGYEDTTIEQLLHIHLAYVSNRTLLPGEGARILVFIRDTIKYINDLKDINTTTLVPVQLIYDIIDNILRQRESLIDETQVILLQRTVLETCSLVTRIFRLSQSFHWTSETLDVTLGAVGGGRGVRAFAEEVSYPAWYGFHLFYKPPKPKSKNETLSLAVAVYRNLSVFLPPRSAIRLKDSTEIEYEILSAIASVWTLPRSSVPSLVMDFDHDAPEGNHRTWTLNCAVTEFAAFSYGWEPQLCQTTIINSTRTRCECATSGTFAVLLTKRASSTELPEENSHKLVIIAGCALCLSLSLATACILTVYWIIRKSCLVFLKVQCSCSVAGVMVVFIVAVCCEPADVSYVYIVTFLESFLLVAMSSQLSKLLIVYTEIVQLPRPGNRKQTVVGITTGVPVIAVFGNHLAYRTMNRRLESWWLLKGSLAFSIFITCAICILVLFIFLYVTVTSKLKSLMDLHEKCSKPLQRRIDALRRSACVFFSIIVFTTSSIAYVNSGEATFWVYELSGSSVFLGLVLILCYILKSETSIRQHLLRRLKDRDKEDSYFSSDSANSPLNFFTKQDPDVESESVPQRRPQILRNGTKLEMEEAAVLEGCSFMEKGKILERYSNSPKHYAKSFLSEAPSVFPQSPDILAPKVCVELDLVASSIKTAQAEIKPIVEQTEVRHMKIFPPVVAPTITPDEAIEKLLEDPSMRNEGIERLQPEGREKLPLPLEPIIEQTTPLEVNVQSDNLDGMLDSISQDLDFLLNRTTEIEPEPPVPVVTGSSFRKISKPPAINIIVEESEDETSKLPESITDVLRTSC